MKEPLERLEPFGPEVVLKAVGVAGVELRL